MGCSAPSTRSSVGSRSAYLVAGRCRVPRLCGPVGEISAVGQGVEMLGAGFQVVGDLLEVGEDDVGEGLGPLVGAAEQDDARRRDGGVGEELAEISIGGNENLVLPVGEGHDLVIRLTAESESESEFVDVCALMAGCAQQPGQRGRQAFVEEESHAVRRTGSSRSSTARAAYSRQACTSAGWSCGYSARMSSVVRPLAIRPTTVATGMRVPATQGTPPMTRWSTLIRATSMVTWWAVRLLASNRFSTPSGGTGRRPARARKGGAAGRSSAGLTYQELADRAHVPVGKLRRAADGKTLPEQATVEAYARGCGRDPRYAVRWRERAEKARQRKLGAAPRRPGSWWPKGLGSAPRPWSLPDPGGPRGIARAAASRAATFDTLVVALKCLRRAAGKPTLKELAETARRNGEWLLPSTASDMLRRKTRRPRREIVLAFARGVRRAR